MCVWVVGTGWIFEISKLLPPHTHTRARTRALTQIINLILFFNKVVVTGHMHI